MNEEIKNILLTLSDRPIAFQKSYSRIAKSTNAGLLLSQILYWCGVQHGKTFYKTNEEFVDETGMSIDEVKFAKKRLQELGFISVSLQGVPAHSVYTVDFEKLVVALSAPVGGKATNLLVGKPPTIYTETTTETTKYIKEKISKPSPLWKESNYLRIVPEEDIINLMAEFSCSREHVLQQAKTAFDWVNFTGKIHTLKNYKSFFHWWMTPFEQRRGHKAKPIEVSVSPTTIEPTELNYFQDKDFNQNIFSTYGMWQRMQQNEDKFTDEDKKNPGSNWNYYKDWERRLKETSPRVHQDVVRRYKEANEPR